MPSLINISSRNTLDVDDVNATDSLIISDESQGGEASYISVEKFLDESQVNKTPYFFTDSRRINFEAKKSQSNFFSHINRSNILSRGSKLIGRLEPICSNTSMHVLPSLHLEKKYNDNFLTLRNFERSENIDIGENYELLISRFFYNNKYHNLKCLFSSTIDSVRFDYIGYSDKYSFDTRLNFVFESYV